ncbi:type IV toxin-antitoxin system AbiEi family antitoxin domain-containing protein [Arthrobacter sp. ov118]|uniref:type IV toxin-antitoxin system AbiEi family antitoxin domain-containing protein n=1 Tax=Arthrobacter sp. ov118 TaxID=1761747 RepID=UPI0008ED3BA7|nr:type IV toxin-antitoxin system AbiEi family antitoxin domain-containing protein [Arthrobacter sp. ov118]SFT77536.1 Transcriptional regulator, AbiEi antitoxin, Type IV TA system [Arthrobacter sp. ov118]
MTQNHLLELPLTGNLWRTEQLLDLGYGSRAIRSLLDSGDLVRLRHGCYIRASLWNPQSPDVRSRQLIFAHAHGTLTTSTGSFLYSHTSSARLHRLYLWDVDDAIHVLQKVNPSNKRHGRGVRCHTRPFAEHDVAVVNGLRTTSLERTTADCAMLLGYRQSLIVMDHALRLGANRQILQAMADSLDGRRGVRTYRRALATADLRSESPGETLARELIMRLKIKVPEPQVEVVTRAGRHRLDFAWKEERVALEFDGKTKYFDYKPTAEVLFEERRREKALAEAGWRFVRIEWKDLFREQEFKERLLRALAGGPRP